MVPKKDGMLDSLFGDSKQHAKLKSTSRRVTVVEDDDDMEGGAAGSAAAAPSTKRGETEAKKAMLLLHYQVPYPPLHAAHSLPVLLAPRPLLDCAYRLRIPTGMHDIVLRSPAGLHDIVLRIPTGMHDIVLRIPAGMHDIGLRIPTAAALLLLVAVSLWLMASRLMVAVRALPVRGRVRLRPARRSLGAWPLGCGAC